MTRIPPATRNMVRHCWIVQEPLRVLVRWEGRGSADWGQIKADFKRAFPGHQNAVWRQGDGYWSVPRHLQEEVAAWAAHWFTEQQISVSDRTTE